jgi:hypothetical protein
MKRKVISFLALVGMVGMFVALLVLIPSKSSVSTAILPRVYAQEQGCGAQTLHGTYIYSADGFVAHVPVQGPFTPIAEAGVYTFDGAGQFSTTNTISVGGQIIPRNATGTYSVNADCTGSVNIKNGATFDFGLTRSAKDMRFVVTTPTVAVMGTMTRQ